jgi:predicted flap endonuclease-1-like 5' DNA nuclease
VDAILTTSPWRELLLIALGAVACGLLVAAVRLGRDALRPRRSRLRRASGSGPAIVPPLPSAPDRSDALEEIDGIDSGTAQVLGDHGIFTYDQLAALSPGQLRFILMRYAAYRSTDPASWPFQARLLAGRRWSDFRRLTSVLNRGQVRLSDVPGVGECHCHVLEDGGIHTVADLQRASPGSVAGLFPAREREYIAGPAAEWIEEARRLHEGDEEALAGLAGLSWDGRRGGRARGFGAWEGTRGVREREAYDGGGWSRRRDRDERYDYRRGGSGGDVLGIPLALALLLLLLLLLFGIGGCVATMTTLSRVDSLMWTLRSDLVRQGGEGRDGRDGRDASSGGRPSDSTPGQCPPGPGPALCIPPTPPPPTPAPPPPSCPAPQPAPPCPDGEICECTGGD